MTVNWYQMTGDAVAEKLSTSKTEGLTRDAAKKLHRKYKNEIYPASKISFYECLKSISTDYTSYLLILTALIAAVFEASIGVWPIIIMVLLNLSAALLTYTKAQKTLEGMDRYTLPVVRVIRDGRLFMIDQKQLVPGDIICLSKGDIVPADARLIEDEEFFVDETYLFGTHHAEDGACFTQKLAEPALHETLPPQKQKNMVFASTLVTGGEALAIVCATGEDTVVCITEKNHPVISHENMPMLSALRKISRVWSLIVIAVVFGMTLLEFFLPHVHHSLFESFIKSMSFAVSTMSEMYMAFGCIVLACAVLQSVHGYGDTGAIIKNPLCMENLKHITCLVVPKEGVFTTRESVVDRIYAGDHLYDITDRKSRRVMERPILYAILSTGMYGLSYLQTQNGKKAVHVVYSEEETAILNLARSMDIYNIRLDRAYPQLDHRCAGGDSLYDTTLVSHKNAYIAVSRGEPEALLARCAYYYKDGRVLLLTQEIRADILLSYRKLARQAYHAIGVASRVQLHNNLRYVGAAQKDMVFEGIVAFRIPYLRGAGQLVTDAMEAGIKVIMLSERTAAAEMHFARQLGIVSSQEQCVDSAQLHQMKEGIRRTNASYYRLYCRLDAAQKQELLAHLHENGEIVGFLGQRLEDLYLLRAADVSFAQNIAVQNRAGMTGSAVSKVSESASADGCEALKFESDVIISDADKKGSGGFRGILDAIRIAKDTDMHIVRIMRYLLSAQTARFLLVMYTIVFAKSGMHAVQTLFSGLFCDFMAVFVLAFQKPEEDALRSGINVSPYLKRPFRENFPSFLMGVCWGCAAIVASFFSELAGFAETDLQSGAVLFLTSTIISVLMLFSVQREEFVWKPGLRMSAVQVLYLLGLTELFLLFFIFPRFGTIFGVVPFALPACMVIAIVCILMLILAECIKMLSRMRRRPDIAAEEEKNGEHRSQLAALFQLFREQQAAEEAQISGDKDRTDTVEQASQTFLDRLRSTPSTEDMETYIKETKAKKKADRKRQKAERKKQEHPAAGGLFAEDDDTADIPFAANAKDVPSDIMQPSADALPSASPDGIPDQHAFAKASEDMPGTPAIQDITANGTTNAALRVFLRDTAVIPTEEETEREFPGLGYLFSEEEYEAIMAEYSQSGEKKDIYSTETQSFDPV